MPSGVERPGAGAGTGTLASLAGTGLPLAVMLCACGIPGRELFLPEMPLRRADAIVVLGNRPPVDERGNVRPETERRVRRGVELYRAGLAPRLIVTGGGSDVVEADVMARFAESLGVPAAAIVREPRARDTAENAGYSVALCPGCRLIVVSAPYHLRRATRLFRCAGARDVQHAATEVPPDLGYQASFTMLEYGVRLAYIFDDACARAREAAAH